MVNIYLNNAKIKQKLRFANKLIKTVQMIIENTHKKKKKLKENC